MAPPVPPMVKSKNTLTKPPAPDVHAAVRIVPGVVLSEIEPDVLAIADELRKKARALRPS